MSCWVVPTLAAELWGMPLEQLLRHVRAGAVPSKVDCGFVVVDVAPGGRRLAAPPARRKRLPPRRTFVPAAVLGDAEVAALAADPAGLPVGSIPPAAEPLAVPGHAVTAGTAAAIEPGTIEPSADELRALGSDDDRYAAPAFEPAASTPPASVTAEPARVGGTDDESEDGPDPNHGEPDDGRPLDWRAAPARVARTRRRPPPAQFD